MYEAVCLPASFSKIFFLKFSFGTVKVYSEELGFLYFIELVTSHLISLFLAT